MGKKERFYCDVMATNPSVTGSCILISVRFPNNETLMFLVDVGSYLEDKYRYLNDSLFFKPENVAFCFITHNHVDHIGRLPFLIKKRFEGTIYTSKPTKSVLKLALDDNFKVMKDEVKRRIGSMLYNSSDVVGVLKSIEGCEFSEEIEIRKNVHVTFLKNGHLPGAALIFVRISYPGYRDINLLFTGDYKSSNAFFEVDPIPQKIRNKRINIIQECTYGDEDQVAKPCFKDNTLNCIKNGGTVVAPVLSFGRAQDVLYNIKLWQDSGELDPNIPIYYDGRLSIAYTEKYLDGYLGIREDMKDFLPKNLIFVDKKSRSTVLADTSPKIIVATSGFGSFGPSQLYIMRFVQRDGNLIHFTTGYMGNEKSMRYKLIHAKYGDYVNIGGAPTCVKAMVMCTAEFSGHEIAPELIRFLKQFKFINAVFVYHGEEDVKNKYAARVKEEVNPKDVEILGNGYFYRIGPYGIIDSKPTKF